MIRLRQVLRCRHPYEYSAAGEQRETSPSRMVAYRRARGRAGGNRKKIIRHVLRAASARSRKTSLPCICKSAAIVPPFTVQAVECNFQTVLRFIIARIVTPNASPPRGWIFQSLGTPPGSFVRLSI